MVSSCTGRLDSSRFCMVISAPAAYGDGLNTVHHDLANHALVLQGCLRPFLCTRLQTEAALCMPCRLCLCWCMAASPWQLAGSCLG